MRRGILKIIFSVIILLPVISVSGQQQAYIHIKEEKGHPYDPFTEKARKEYSWIINGTSLGYKTGMFSVPVHAAGISDTIIFQQIYNVNGASRRARHAVYDTVQTISICKFRAGGNYSISQLYPGDFEIFSLDTFESKKNLVFKISGLQNQDTVYLHTAGKFITICSDTVLKIITTNEKMEQSFTESIQLNRSKPVYCCQCPAKTEPDIFLMNFQYLHAETLIVEYDISSKQYKIRIE